MKYDDPFDLSPDISVNIDKDTMKLQFNNSNIEVKIESFMDNHIFNRKCIICKKNINVLIKYRYCLDCKGFLCESEMNHHWSKHRIMNTNNFCMRHNYDRYKPRVYNQYIRLNCK